MDVKQRTAVLFELLKSGPWMHWYKDKEFTQDWTTAYFPHWMQVLSSRQQRPHGILEIGSFEGRSAIFWLHFFPDCRLTCVDHFATTKKRDGAAIERRFDANIAEFGDRVTKIKSSSVKALVELAEAGRHFDLIYIDGSHRRDDVMVDALLAWKILQNGGLLIFDDYEHDLERPRAERPKDAINCFLQFHQDDIRLISTGYQIILERVDGRT